MKRLMNGTCVLLLVLGTALVAGYLHRSGTASAAPAPPCTISCACKEIYAYKTIDPVAGDQGPFVYALKNPNGTYSPTTHARSISTTGGCMAGEPGVTVDPIYRIAIAAEPVCSIETAGNVECTTNINAIIQTTAPLTSFGRARCVLPPPVEGE